MRTELRACEHCFDGEHEQAVSRDLVACAQGVREHRDELDLDDVRTRMLGEEGDDGRPAAIPAVGATIRGEQLVISDTQLITVGENGYMLVSPGPQDAPGMLAVSLDGMSKVTSGSITPGLLPESAESPAENGIKRSEPPSGHPPASPGGV